jgi:hypothetical protein
VLMNFSFPQGISMLMVGYNSVSRISCMGLDGM